MNIDTSLLKYDREIGSYYSADDLNRVKAFCQTVVDTAKNELAVITDMQNKFGVAPSEYSSPSYTVPTVISRKDFEKNETFTQNDLNVYLANVTNVISHFPVSGLRLLPNTMRYLTYEGANNIEWNLKQAADELCRLINVTEQNIKDIAADFQYSGELYAGGTI